MKIEHRIGVKAPPLVVWDLIKDIERWPSWNPIYTEARGRLGYGAELQFTSQLPDQAEPIPIVGTVTEWIPEEQLHWTTSTMYGLVKTTRYIEIDKLTETACIFANGEMVTGFLAKSAARKYGRSMYKGFELMGEKVKELAEILYADQLRATS